MGIKDFFSRVWRGRSRGALVKADAQADGETLELAKRLGDMAGQLGDEAANYVLQRVQTVSQALSASTYDANTALKEAMRSNVWVGRAAKILGDAVASIAPRAQSEVELDRWENLGREHPYARLLRRPAPGQPYPVWASLVVLHLVFRGECSFAIVRSRADGRSAVDPSRGIPVELAILEPHRTETLRDPVSGETTGYRDTKSGTTWGLGDVFRVFFPDPSNHSKAIAPYEWTRHEANQDIKATIWNTAAFDNRVGADMIIEIEPPGGEAGGWDSSDAWLATRNAFRAAYLSALNARTPVITGEKIKATPVPNASHIDLDFGDGRKLTREGTTAGLGVPPMMAGIMDAAALNNFKIAKQVLAELTTIPFLAFLEAALNELLSPEYGENVRAHWDAARIPELFPRFAERGELAVRFAERAVPWSEISRVLDLGLEPWPGWDGVAATDAQAATLMSALQAVAAGQLDPTAATLFILSTVPTVSADYAVAMVVAQTALTP